MHASSPSAADLRELDADSAVARLTPLTDEAIAELLHDVGPGRAVAILDRFGAGRLRSRRVRTRESNGSRDNTGRKARWAD